MTGEREWTPGQRHAIEAAGGTVLVAAAAGSGKTAVLVERVIRKITDPVHPVDVDRLLIVTFTRAAAAEMRQRLSAALAEKSRQEPENTLYQRQQMLLPQASISTVHGFCADLLRRHAGALGLPPRFRVADDGEAKLLRSRALDTVLEESYARRDPAFMALAAQLCGDRDDRELREAVKKTDGFMQAQPVPARWLREHTAPYTAVSPAAWEDWTAPLLRYTAARLDWCARMAAAAAALADREGPEVYLDTLKADQKQFETLAAALPGMAYSEARQALMAVDKARLPAYRGEPLPAKDQIQKWRTDAYKKWKELCELLADDEAQIREDLTALAPAVDALGTLTARYREEYTALKRQKRLLDYDDLEHEALRLLLTDEGTPTPTALEIAAGFAEILVDEYQDTNAVQDALFRAVSRNGENLFMVGDVKQSIYGFRMARPEIFTARRDEYVPYDEAHPAFPAAITLQNNFRSRQTVTDGVNFVFRQLMIRPLGGVAYDEREALQYSARYNEQPGCETEWHLLRCDGDDEDAPARPVAEARRIAKRIREMMAGMTVQRGEGTRPLEYGDICILLRSRTHMATIARELMRVGIPVTTDGEEAFLSLPEIGAVMALLRVIDNPLRDVELAAALLSPIGGFSADDLARIRLIGRKAADGEGARRRLPLYSALIAAADSGEDPALADRCRVFVGLLRRARTLAVTVSADRLLERLYRELSIPELYAARPGGRQRVDNLHRLDSILRSFEQGEYRGLSAFVRYVDGLEEQGEDLPAGTVLRSDSVRIMTIHSSKGLEFPVVFLAMLNTPFNTQDQRSRLLFHQQAGIGLRRRDTETLEKNKTLAFRGVNCADLLDARAEELRVLYVAMTRAREKLCLIISAKDPAARLTGLRAMIPADRALTPGALLGASSPADWLLTAALRHPDFAPLCGDAAGLPVLAAACPWTVTVSDADTAEAAQEECPADAVPDTELQALLRPRLEYEYPFAAFAAVPAKLAASQLSHEAMSRERIGAARPAFLERDGLTAAQKGTALHTFMQFADYARAAADPAAEARRLTEAGFLTERERQSLPLDRITRFFTGALYARMAVSADCRREFHFTVAVPAAMASDQPLPDSDETVVVQGIADCVFLEGDGLVLVDYKTDHVRDAAELIDRYRSQMDFYRRAMTETIGLPVRQVLLYSFSLGHEIEVPQ